jgi:hypothetical protein
MIDVLWTIPNVIFSCAEAYYNKPYPDLSQSEKKVVISSLCWHMAAAEEQVYSMFNLEPLDITTKSHGSMPSKDSLELQKIIESYLQETSHYFERDFEED